MPAICKRAPLTAALFQSVVDFLAARGLRGRELGEMLSFLLGYVMEYPDNNRRELLLSLASASEE